MTCWETVTWSTGISNTKIKLILEKLSLYDPKEAFLTTSCETGSRLISVMKSLRIEYLKFFMYRFSNKRFTKTGFQINSPYQSELMHNLT